MSAALDLITDRVRERVRREGVDLAADADLADRYVREEVRSYSERALGGSSPMLGDETAAARQIIAAVTGLGPLQPLLDDLSVEEVWINAPDGALAKSTLTSPGAHEDVDVMIAGTPSHAFTCKVIHRFRSHLVESLWTTPSNLWRAQSRVAAL